MKTARNIIQACDKILLPVVKFLDRLSWIMLFAMMAVTVTDLFLRNFTNSGILGSIEMTEFLMVMVVFFSLARCETKNGHIRVELVMEKFSDRSKILADIFTQTLCTVLFVLMTISIYRHAASMKASGEVTMDLHLPIYPIVYVAAAGCLVMTLVLMLKTLSLIIRKGRP